MTWYLRNAHLDLYGCDLKDTSKKVLQEVLVRAPDKISMKPIMKPVIIKDPLGLVGYMGMETSELVIDTYPVIGTTLIELSTCGSCNVDEVIDHFVGEFGANKYELVYVEGKIPKGPLNVLSHKTHGKPESRFVKAGRSLLCEKENDGYKRKYYPSYSTSIVVADFFNRITEGDLNRIRPIDRTDIHLFKPQGETMISFRSVPFCPRVGWYVNTWPEYDFAVSENRSLFPLPGPYKNHGYFTQSVSFLPNIVKDWNWDLIRKVYTTNENNLTHISR